MTKTKSKTFVALLAVLVLTLLMFLLTACSKQATLAWVDDTPFSKEYDASAFVLDSSTYEKTGDAEVVVTYYQGDEVVEQAVDVGTYKVVVSLPATKNYKAAESIEKELTITKGTYTGCDIRDYNVGKYDGTKKRLKPMIVSGEADGDYLFSLTEDGEYTELYPQVYDAGVYTVYYKFIPNNSNYNIVMGSVKVTVEKASTVYISPMAQKDLVYNGTEQQLISAGQVTTVAGTFTYSTSKDGNYSTDVLTGTNAGTYKVYWKFTPTDATNYSSTWGVCDITIAKAENEWTTEPSITGWTSGSIPNEPVAEAKYGTVVFTYEVYSERFNTWATPMNPISSSTSAGTYRVTAYVVGTDNYTALSKTVVFTIS